jgi:hypothetical protein
VKKSGKSEKKWKKVRKKRKIRKIDLNFASLCFASKHKLLKAGNSTEDYPFFQKNLILSGDSVLLKCILVQRKFSFSSILNVILSIKEE